MKLTNQQIDAICNLAQKQFEAKLKKVEKPVLTDKERSQAIETSSIFNSIPNWAFEIAMGAYNSKFKTASYWEERLKAKKQTKIPTFNRSEFKDKIHLASIETDDLKNLYSKLGIKD